MAKVGYIFKADRYDGFEADKEWMQKYGCVQVIEELVENEALRPRWKQLVANLERGDEIVVAKFSNALRGSRELSAFIESVSYTHLRAHETRHDLVCRLLLEKKKKKDSVI